MSFIFIYSIYIPHSWQFQSQSFGNFAMARLEDLAPTAVTLDLLASIVGDARRYRDHREDM
jgi:hypothetical protein